MTKTNNLDWIIEPKQDKRGLAIANIRYFDEPNLQKDNVKAVISVFGQKELILGQEIQHLRILIADNPKENISIFFPSSYDFIEKNMKKGNVVVHCQAGVSRSVSIVMAYILRKQRISFDQCLQFVQQRRPIAYPNKGFTKQLKAFAQQVKNFPKETEKNDKKCEIF